jgi:hypothetical protein
VSRLPSSHACTTRMYNTPSGSWCLECIPACHQMPMQHVQNCRRGVQVWHNYGFDKHILQRRALGIDPEVCTSLGVNPEKLKLGGFAGDTLHLARLHDAGRKGTKTYSLASLSGDTTVMSSGEDSVIARSKVSMKELFSLPKLTKSGAPSASLKELPPIHEIQVSGRRLIAARICPASRVHIGTQQPLQ